MILAIGERFNGKEWEPTDTDSFRLRVDQGLYNHGSRRQFLNKVGVHWDHGINLLWPCSDPNDWDVREARRVANVLRQHMENYDKIILFGRKVCDAFEVPYKVGLVFGRFIPLPHPMGNTKLWNKDFIRRILE